MSGNLQFKGKYILTGKIRTITGLHIGGSAVAIEIGGVDNPVLKDPLTDLPYIPGSALKGKLRSLFEWNAGLIMKQPKQQDKYAAHDCRELMNKREEAKDPVRWDNAFALARLFGPASDEEKVRECAGPTRLIVRDAFPTGYSTYVASGNKIIAEGTTLAKWAEWLGEGIFTEIKTENSIDRVTSEAMPRPMERVPASSEFEFEMLLDIYRDDDKALFQGLFTAMKLLENSALGGGGSRGHGQVEFKDLELKWRPLTYYQTGQGEQAVILPGKDVKSLADVKIDLPA